MEDAKEVREIVTSPSDEYRLSAGFSSVNKEDEP